MEYGARSSLFVILVALLYFIVSRLHWRFCHLKQLHFSDISITQKSIGKNFLRVQVRCVDDVNAVAYRIYIVTTWAVNNSPLNIEPWCKMKTVKVKTVLCPLNVQRVKMCTIAIAIIIYVCIYYMYFLSCAFPKQFNNRDGSIPCIRPKRDDFGWSSVEQNETYIAFMSVSRQHLLAHSNTYRFICNACDAHINFMANVKELLPLPWDTNNTISAWCPTGDVFSLWTLAAHGSNQCAFS